MDPSVEELRRARLAGFGASAAFHALIAAIALYPVARYGLVPVQPAAPREGPVVFLGDALPAPDAPSLPGLNPAEPGPGESALTYEGKSLVVAIPGFTFDFGKIASRAPLLFPFVSPGLSLDRFALEAPRGGHLKIPDSLRRASQAPGGGSKPPLSMDEDGIQALIDKSWSRRDRWSVFHPVAALAGKHDADAGGLPVLFRQYAEQNGLQPYTDPGFRDPRLWTELGLAADHVEFVGFISQYTLEHPSTRGATELLFLLDKLTMASRDALVTLLDTNADADLRWTRRANAEAFSFIVQAQRHYNTVLENKKLLSRADLGAFYDSLRLQILSGILDTTPDGYRANDARFLMGAIYWKQGKKSEAVGIWRAVRADERDCFLAANRAIAAALQPAAAGGPVSESEIERILAADTGRWLADSIDRLRQFGFRMYEY